MKKIFAAALTALLCFCMAGCSSAGTISTYTMVLDSMPKNLDPQVAASPEELMIISNTFDGLFEYRNGTVTKNVCEDYSVSSDGLSYTFMLKDDSSFYVNKTEQIPVTAHDFVFALNRIMDPSTRSPYYDDFANIQSVTAESDSVLVIRLKKADSNFLAKLCMPCAVPCNQEFFENTKGAYGLTVKTILSNGPFTINYLADDGSYATLIRVKDYSGGIDRIRVSLTGSGQTAAELYANDSISGYFAASDSDANGTACLCDNSLFNMYFNTQNETLKSQYVRGALAYYCYGMENSGANLSAVVQNYSLFPSSVTFGDVSLNDMLSFEKPSYMSCTSPKDLLNQGFAELDTVKLGSLKVLVPNDVKYSVIVENINQMWQKNLGAFFSLEFLSSQEIADRIAKGDFDIAFYSHTLQKNDPLEVLTPFCNIDETVNMHVSMLEGGYMSDTDRLNAISCAHKDIVEMAYAVPMCTDSSYYIHKSYFTGVEINPFGNLVNLKYAKVK